MLKFLTHVSSDVVCSFYSPHMIIRTCWSQNTIIWLVKEKTFCSTLLSFPSKSCTWHWLVWVVGRENFELSTVVGWSFGEGRAMYDGLLNIEKGGASLFCFCICLSSTTMKTNKSEKQVISQVLFNFILLNIS